AYFNWEKSRDWTGSLIEDQPFKAPQPLVRMFGNLEITLALNLTPPVAPFANAWNDRIAPKFTPAKLQEKFRTNLQHIERNPLGIDEMQTDISGLGLQISLLLFGSTVAALILARRSGIGAQKWTWTQRLVVLATAIAYLAFIKTAFVLSLARLLAPFYAF